jgi:hypothetical protein
MPFMKKREKDKSTTIHIKGTAKENTLQLYEYQKI